MHMLSIKNIDAALEAMGNGEDMDKVLDMLDPWVQIGTTAIDGTDAELAAAFNVVPGAVGPCIHGLIEGGHVVEVRGRHLRPIEWVDDHHGCRLVHCDIVRRQSEIDAEMATAVSMFSDALSVTMHAKSACPECGPHGNAGRVLLLESWVDCTTCRPTAAALSRELIADGASAAVVAEGVRAFMSVLRHDPAVAEYHPPVPVTITYNNDGIRTGMQMLDKAMSGLAVPTAATYANYLEAVRQGIIEATPLDGQVILDDGKTVATYVDGREVSRRGRF